MSGMSDCWCKYACAALARVPAETGKSPAKIVEEVAQVASMLCVKQMESVEKITPTEDDVLEISKLMQKDNLGFVDAFKKVKGIQF